MMNKTWLGLVAVVQACGGAPAHAPTPAPVVRTDPAPPVVARPEPARDDAPSFTGPMRDAIADLDFDPPLRAKASGHQIASTLGATPPTVEPPRDPDRSIEYRVVHVADGRVWFLADVGDATHSFAHVLVDADATLFTQVTLREVVLRPTASPGDDEEQAPGVWLPFASEVTVGSIRDGWAEVSYEGQTSRGHGFVPADAIARTYQAAKPRHRMPAKVGKDFLAPGTKLLSAPDGAPLAEVTIPKAIARPGARLPIEVLAKKGAYALVSLGAPWPDSASFVRGPAARAVGWVKQREILPDKRLPLLDLTSGGLHGTGMDYDGVLVELQPGAALYRSGGGTQIGVVTTPMRRPVPDVAGRRLLRLETNAGALEVEIAADDPNIRPFR